MRKIKIGRIMILVLVSILILTGGLFSIRMLFWQKNLVEEKSYYDLDLFRMG